MTLKEAKKILNKEGFHMALANRVIYQSGAIREFEKPEVCEAIKVANANRWTVALSPAEWVERESRLKKEYEERSNAPVPGKEQQEEKIRIIFCSASRFNDALSDEQADEIKCIKEKNLRLGREIARLNKNICRKNMKIADLGKELKAAKKELKEKTELVETVRKGSEGYCEYGIAAEKMIQKMAKDIVNDRPVSPKDYEQYRRWANGYRFNPQLYDFIEEEEKRFSPAEDTHPTEDNPEEVKMNEILEHVRKVLEEGGTVSTSYGKAEKGGDQSAAIVQHRKSIVGLFKGIRRLWQE